MRQHAKFGLILLVAITCGWSVSIAAAASHEKLSTNTEIEGKNVYDKACASCHDQGVAGAPKFGEPDDWSARTDKGMQTLIDHAINGFQGEEGMMPPKGGFSDLSDAEVKAAVKYMIDKST